MTTADRMLDLLAEQSDRRLDAAERRELVQLASEPGAPPVDAFERAAAAIALAELEAEGALLEIDEAAMPPALLAQLEAAALDQMIEAVTAPRPLEPMPPAPRKSTPSKSADVAANDTGKGMPAWLAYGGWMAAVAAVIALVATRGEPKPGATSNEPALAAGTDACEACPELPPPPPAPPSDVEKRQTLQAQPEALRLAWAKTDDPLAGEATGDVVWSNEAQEGYMRFVGLPVNDPGEQQYQLWIFDKGRSDKTPVDGGVFDVTEAGEVIVPIDPKVRVDEAVMFAVTVERPGGVVVSDRAHIVTLAKLG